MPNCAEWIAGTRPGAAGYRRAWKRAATVAARVPMRRIAAPGRCLSLAIPAGAAQALDPVERNRLEQAGRERHDERSPSLVDAHFGGREIGDGEAVLEMTVPAVPRNPAVVPVSLRARVPQRTGGMQIRPPGAAMSGKPSRVDLRIDHPDYNGLQVSISPGIDIPVYTLQSVGVTQADEWLMGIGAHESLSHGPPIRLFFRPQGPGEPRARALDSARARFEPPWPVGPVAQN